MESLRDGVSSLEKKMQQMANLLRYAQFEVPSDENDIRRLLETAQEMKALHLVNQCGEKLAETLNDENAIQLYQFAVDRGINNLATAARKYILSHFMSIYQSEVYVNLSFDDLSAFLKSDDLNVTGEEIAFQTLTTWVRKDKNKRQYVIKDINKYVRFMCCDTRFLKSILEHFLLYECEDVLKSLRQLIKDKEENTEAFQEQVNNAKRTCLK